ncbi:MAG: type IV pilin N-terminal domain-containing protein [Methanoregula sp.]|nr:type IV pilin N-terminal domain-containing protein [Methanoregula sp.]
MMRRKDAAVSPVVGVMLMLVVTIIIAAVVSAFAGGLTGNQQKTPQTTFAVKGVIQDIQGTIDPDTYELTYPAGFNASNGFQFENTGGDTISLSDIKIQLQTEDTKYTLLPTDTLPVANSILPAGISNGGYFQKIGNTSVSDKTIAPGDKFMLYADGCAKAVTYTYDNSYYGPKISWTPSSAEHGFSLYLNTKIQYKIIDKDSNGVISSGELYLTQ